VISSPCTLGLSPVCEELRNEYIVLFGDGVSPPPPNKNKYDGKRHNCVWHVIQRFHHFFFLVIAPLPNKTNNFISYHLIILKQKYYDCNKTLFVSWFCLHLYGRLLTFIVNITSFLRVLQAIPSPLPVVYSIKVVQKNKTKFWFLTIWDCKTSLSKCKKNWQFVMFF
jgi:hypothetical protein